MANKPAAMQRLKAAATKAAARAASAKEQVRSAKVLLKQARKAFKAEKKAAKQARRQVDAAAAALGRDRAAKAAAIRPKPTVRGATRTPLRDAGRNAAPVAASRARPAPKTRTPKPRVPKPADTMRSAAEVAKSVIERLHSPPPVLAPAALIPSDLPAARVTSASPRPDSPSRDAPANPDQNSAES